MADEPAELEAPWRDDHATISAGLGGSGGGPTIVRRSPARSASRASLARASANGARPPARPLPGDGAVRPPHRRVVLPPARPRRPITVYECQGCGARAVGQQRCEECGTFMRKLGLGGPCPHCDEPVAVTELLDQEVVLRN